MKHNFSAGPAILPKEVLQEASEAVIDYKGMGLSLIEISHRGKEFTAIMEEALALPLELLGLNQNEYTAMFLQGGASMQFTMVPYNLLTDTGTAAYVNTGVWAKKSVKEAKLIGNVTVIASSEDQNYAYIPKPIIVPSDVDYCHITSNNTIYGTQFHAYPKCTVPMVVDMSSDIFSRKVDASQFGLIYAGAQKNMGPAGTTLVIIRNDLLGKSGRNLPTMLDYRTHTENGSMFNTPPVFPIYVSMLTMRWIKSLGGTGKMEVRNRAKADLLYHELDTNPSFYGTVVTEDRSDMNVNFLLTKPELDETFLNMTKEAGIVGIKGHRSVGGFRASLYNALPLESVTVLVDVMKQFAQKFG